MSSIDKRIVQMQFDNAQFEAGVARSMNTLDELNKKLQFKEAQNGLSSLMVAVDGLSTKSISTAINALDRISSYSTTILGKMASEIKSQFADKILNAIESIPMKAMSQIKSGGWNRAMNIANAQFQIEGLQYSWDKVRAAADYAVTDTAYGLDAAAKAASQLAASGVDFEKVIGKDGAGAEVTQMHKSLRAISGVAAMTNASYDDIAHTFTRIAGQGRVMANDLNSLASRGLNAAATLAKALNVTEAEVRDMVSKGAIDFQTFSEAMDEAYGDHAKEANKTFTGALSNMKAALSRIGAIFTQPVIDKTNTFFVAVTDRIKEFQKALNDDKGYRLTKNGLAKIRKEAADAAKKFGYVGIAQEEYIKQAIKNQTDLVLNNKKNLEEALKSGDVEQYSIARFATHFAEAWEAAIQFVSKVTTSLDLSWFKTIGSFLDTAAQKTTKFFNNASKAIDKVKESIDGASKSISDSLNLDINDLNLLHRILKNEFGYVEERWAKLDKIYQEQGSSKTGKWLQGYMDQLAGVGYNFETLGWTEEEFKKKQEELAKTEGQRAKEMTAEEVAIDSMANAILRLRTVTESLKTSFSNFGSGVKALLSNFVKISSVFTKGLFGGTGFEAIGESVIALTEAFRDLTESLRVSEGPLTTVFNFGTKIGNVFTTAASKVLEFATEILKMLTLSRVSREEFDKLLDSGDLTPLQESAYHVVRAFESFITVVKNLVKAVVSFVRPIIKAFKNVFNPTGILSGVADFEEGIAGLSEKLILSEEAAEVVEIAFGGLFTAIQKVFTIVTKTVGSIAKFIGSLGNAKKPTSDVKDTLTGVEETGEKTNTIFGNLKTTLENFSKKIKEIPQKFEELKDAVNQQEGVIRLKESFEKLKTSIKEAIEKAKPFKKDIEEVGEAAGGTGETAIGKLASGIGIVAGKLADFIDKLPGYGAKIEEFWNNVKETVEGWISKIHFDQFFDNLGTGVTEFFTSDDSIIGKIKAFATSIFEGITGALEDIDWKKVGKGSMIALIAANLFNFFKITSGVEKTIGGIASIPKQIAGIFKNLGNVFITANKSLKKITNMYLFVSLVTSIMMLVTAISMLGEMPIEKLKIGIAALSWIAILMIMLGKAVELMTRHVTQGDRINQRINEIDKSQKNLLQINNTISGLIGAGILLAGIGAAIFLVTKGLVALGQEMKKNSDGVNEALYYLAISAGIVVIAFAIVAAISAATAKTRNEGKHALGNLIGAGVLVAGLGAAVWLFAKALMSLSDYFDGKDFKSVNAAFLSILVIMGLLTVFTYVAGHAMREVDWKAVGMMAVFLTVAVGAIAVIGAEVLGMAYLLNKFQDKIPADSVMYAMGIMASIMLSVGLMLFLMGKGLENVDHPGALIGLVFMMGLFVAALVAAVIIMAQKLSEGNINKEKLITGLIGIAGIMAVTGLVVFAIAALANNKFQGVDRVRDTLLSIGAVFLLIGVFAILLSEAVSILGSCDPKAMYIMAGFMAAAFLLIYAISKMAVKGKFDADKIGETLVTLSIAFVAIAAAALGIAAAVKILSGVQLNGAIIGTFIAMVALIGVLLFVASKLDPTAAANFEKMGIAVALMGASFLLAGAGVWLLAKAIETIVSLAGGIVTTIVDIATALTENKIIIVVILGIVAAIVALIWLVNSIMKYIGPVVSTVLTAIQAVVSVIAGAIETIGNHLKQGGKTVSTWWKDLQPKLKIGIVTGIATLCAAILKASPEMLKTIKELIKKLIFFIIDIIPTVVDGLIQILIRLLNSLADTIRKNSAEIAYAFWNIIEALLEIGLDLLTEAIAMFLKPFTWMLRKFGADEFADKIESGIGGVGKIANELKASMRSGLKDAKDYAKSTEEIVESMTGLDSAMNEVNKDLKKESISYENTSAGLAKYKGELEATKTAQSKLDVSTEGLINRFKKSGGIAETVAGFKSTIVPEGEIGFDLSKLTPTEAGEVDTSTFMESMGVDESTMSFEAYDSGEAYTDNFAAGMTSEDSQQQIESAANDNVDIVKDTISKRDKDLQDATRIGIITPYNRTIVGNASTSYDNGYYIVQRAIDGGKKAYEDNKDQIKKTAAEGADLIWRGANSKDGIDANSPSKKFYQSGLWCVLGIQQAIKDNAYLATGQVADLGGSMVSSIGDSMDYVAKIASGEIEYDPRIRPVLDISSVGRGASGINSLFTNQNVSLAGLSGQIAYDMTNLNGSNAAVVAELQSLREDMAIMTEEMANMQIVMDTGALVGSTVGAYDDALGRRAIYGERGN